MVLARCEKCGRPQGKKGNAYVAKYPPAGYPNSGVICGSPGCEQPAFIWILDQEQLEYDKGRRVFDFPTRAVKVRIS